MSVVYLVYPSNVAAVDLGVCRTVSLNAPLERVERFAAIVHDVAELQCSFILV